MSDYKQMYLKMMIASEQAINILIAAQTECEEIYVSSPESALQAVALPPEGKKDADKN
ncbi:MAG: hypothetical protein AAGU74_05535 [Bacillota bacterium]